MREQLRASGEANSQSSDWEKTIALWQNKRQTAGS